jgi:hypothetical protein
MTTGAGRRHPVTFSSIRHSVRTPRTGDLRRRLAWKCGQTCSKPSRPASSTQKRRSTKEAFPKQWWFATKQLRDGFETAAAKTRESVTNVVLPLTHSTLSRVREEASQIATHSDLKPVLSYLHTVTEASLLTSRFKATAVTDVRLIS